jgi:hypothetical protein
MFSYEEFNEYNKLKFKDDLIYVLSSAQGMRVHIL